MAAWDSWLSRKHKTPKSPKGRRFWLCENSAASISQFRVSGWPPEPRGYHHNLSHSPHLQPTSTGQAACFVRWLPFPLRRRLYQNMAVPWKERAYQNIYCCWFWRNKSETVLGRHKFWTPKEMPLVVSTWLIFIQRKSSATYIATTPVSHGLWDLTMEYFWNSNLKGNTLTKV